MDQIPVYLVLSLPLIGAFAMFALGLAVIYRASRVLNLAHGAMAMVPAFIAHGLARQDLPMPVWATAGVLTGALLGIVVERVFVRTLHRFSPAAQTVGTVAALGVTVSIAIRVWGTTPRTAPSLFPSGGIGVGSSTLRWGDLGIFVVAVGCSVAMFAMFRLTNAGRAMQAAADNKRGASLVGIDPDASTRLAWAIGGALAALAGMLLAAVTALEPVGLVQVVLPAFVAILIGGLHSVPGALVGAGIVGVVQGMVPAIGLLPGVGSFATQVGAPQLVLTVLALIVMVLRGQRLVGAGRGEEFVSSQRRRRRLRDAAQSAPERVRVRPPPALLWLGFAALLLWPIVAPFSIVGDAINACILAIIASSLVLLTGWVGQISLAQASFVGIGAFATAALANHADLDFPVSLPLTALIAAAAAALLGVVALRVRGLYLAVATLIFVWMCDEYLFRSAWFAGGAAGTSVDTPPVGTREALLFFDLSERKTYYYVALAAAAGVLWALSNLRDSKTGRAFHAVRGSEVAAASLGIDVTRMKLLAFSMSGLLAGVAGSLVAVLQGSVEASQFTFKASLFYLAVAVVGGLQSLGGGVAAAIAFAALNELFFRVSALAGWLEVVGAGLLAVVLLAYPGGLGAALRSVIGSWRPRPVRQQPRRWFGRAPAAPPSSPNGPRSSAPALSAMRLHPPADGLRPLVVQDVTVRFGGLTAVQDFSLEVRHGQIVGLIGPNGAGKTTLFNAISGLVTPERGTVTVYGQDVTGWPVHRRSRLGVARTFQTIQLFGGMTVFDNLLVATHCSDPTGPGSHLLVTRPALEAEIDATMRVREVVEQLGLQDVAGRDVAGLPFGVLRMVELARAITTGGRLIMLDEPASGLDTAETGRLGSILRRLRDELDLSILLIEHDVGLVTSVSDHVYVIDRGAPLAHGSSSEIRRDESVIAAYLGTDPEFGGGTPQAAMMAPGRA